MRKQLNEADSDYLKIGNKVWPKNMVDYDPDMNAGQVNREAQRRLDKEHADQAEAERVAKEKAEAERVAKEKADKAAALSAKSEEILKAIKEDPKFNSEDPGEKLEAFFGQLVPRMGKCDSVAGELVRAMMRILYRYYNDGDYFYRGYGCETAGPAALFIGDTLDCYGQLEDIEARELEDERYEEAINGLCTQVINYILEHTELISEPAEDDYLNTYDNWEEIRDYEYDIDVSGDYIDQMIEDDFMSWEDIAYELEDWVNNEYELKGADFDQWARDAFRLTNLTRDQYEWCEQEFQKQIEDWIEERYKEYQDSYDDEEEEDW